jgi:hypothetical protein
MPAPQSKDDVKRFLGMMNYVEKFIPHLSELTVPLRDLLKKTSVFTWGAAEQQSFDACKQKLVTAPVLSYFRSDLPITISCDASSRGLRATIFQQGKPVAYASKALTPTEVSYAQIEKEALAICFA